jgi:pilus assembly protein FimV
MNCSITTRLWTLVAGVVAGVWPLLSCALGLGDIQVDSRLNQPLRARIEIVDVSDEEWRQVHAQLALHAAPNDGAAHPELLGSITLTTSEDLNHRHFVELRSANVLTEPLFDLPIEVAGQSVQVVRNYSVMLDPAIRDDVSASPREAVSAAPRAAQSGNTPAVAAGLATAGGAAVSVAAESGVSGAIAVSVPAAPMIAGAAAAAVPVAPAAPVAATSHPAAVYIVTRSDTLARIARRLGGRTAAERNQMMKWIYEHNPHAFYGDMRHLHAGAHLTLPEGRPAASRSAGSRTFAHSAKRGRPYPDAPVVTPQEAPVAESAANGAEPVKSAESAKSAEPAKSAEQEQLEGQLASLQQALTTMQATISAQNAEIARLTGKIAARVEPPAAHELAVSSPTFSADASDSEPVAPGARHATYYWSVGLGTTTILALVLAWYVRGQRETSGGYARAEKEASSARTPAIPERLQASYEPPPSPSAERIPSSDMSTPKPPRQHEARRENSSSTDVNRALWSTPGGLQSWRAQNRLAKLETTSETDKLFVLDLAALESAAAAQDETQEMLPAQEIHNRQGDTAGEAAEGEQPLPSTAEVQSMDPQHGRSLVNKEIVKVLENSSGFEPDRVDIKIKLLEIYHHEALGNRDNFLSLLNKLAANPHLLSPAQQQHVEKLQRTLNDGKLEADSDFVTQVAM